MLPICFLLLRATALTSSDWQNSNTSFDLIMGFIAQALFLTCCLSVSFVLSICSFKPDDFELIGAAMSHFMNKITRTPPKVQTEFLINQKSCGAQLAHPSCLNVFSTSFVTLPRQPLVD